MVGHSSCRSRTAALLSKTETGGGSEPEVLSFPTFRHELLKQSYWSPADDLGRIKLVISEGFPRNSQTNPIERVQNVVAFSFQHAPLGMCIRRTHPFLLILVATDVTSRDSRGLFHRMAQSGHVATCSFRCDTP